ncbi:SelT/SelW/SelH family protein [Marinibactrum halimedae]|uniref:SelT/SelW/SelH family protein n=1 Tax=Marinibactrum halimedae TaxID=1444977 RepID=A0AA37WN23_9GAMM|nr:SelT/SelW/SelH family protein [Marinibactrum halimedae]MCD9458971.1 SelT/SelW/SelH family protein [Marinibactrum halimedae]GLS26900.1 hypothetical protein GCM10007877_26190 [Marinibactrum halimedae]
MASCLHRTASLLVLEQSMAGKTIVKIHYCTQCNWLLRSAWLAQELLTTFADDVQEVALCPSAGGHFEILVDEICVWERKKDGGFPDAKVLKQRVRDHIEPERDLGHIDREKKDIPPNGQCPI